jgi:hypothetical protein
MRCSRKCFHTGYAILALSSAACDKQPTSNTSLFSPAALLLVGTVTSQSGAPLAGASVHSQAYEPDCSTPMHVERDTLLVTDANGAFKGFLTTPSEAAVCVHVYSSLGTTSGAAQFVPSRFGLPSESGQASDTVAVHLTIP